MSESRLKETEQKRLVMLEYRLALLDKLQSVKDKLTDNDAVAKLRQVITKLTDEIATF